MIPIRKGIKMLYQEGLSETMFAIADYIELQILYQIVWLLHGKLLMKDDVYVIRDIISGDELYFPHFSDHRRAKKKHWRQLNNSYFISDHVELGQDEVVIDVGAYIGITSILAAKRAEQVYAIEPSPRALKCLNKNVENYDNIEVLPYAAWNQSEKIKLNYGAEANEDALIQPDDGGIMNSTLVQAHSVSTIAEIENINKIDYLKIEAEGVEPEIVEGIAGLDIQKVVSTGNAERHGETTFEQVSNLLIHMGYEVKILDDHLYKMVYGRK